MDAGRPRVAAPKFGWPGTRRGYVAGRGVRRAGSRFGTTRASVRPSLPSPAGAAARSARGRKRHFVSRTERRPSSRPPPARRERPAGSITDPRRTDAGNRSVAVACTARAAVAPEGRTHPCGAIGAGAPASCLIRESPGTRRPDRHADGDGTRRNTPERDCAERFGKAASRHERAGTGPRRSPGATGPCGRRPGGGLRPGESRPMGQEDRDAAD